MQKLELIKKYLPSIVYTVLGIFVLFIIYKTFMRLKGSALAVGGVIADTAENTEISHSTGISTARINELRGLALRLAKTMETWKDLGTYDRWTHMVWDTDIVDLCKGIKSAEEMSVVKNFYQNIFTTNRSLYQDLQDEISKSNFAKINFTEALY